MFHGERVALYAELYHARQLAFDALHHCPPAATYFSDVWRSIYSTFEADEALDSAAKLEQEFIDLNPSLRLSKES